MTRLTRGAAAGSGAGVSKDADCEESGEIVGGAAENVSWIRHVRQDDSWWENEEVS